MRRPHENWSVDLTLRWIIRTENNERKFHHFSLSIDRGVFYVFYFV